MSLSARLGLDCDGIHQQINQCILECGLDMRSTLYVNVVLSGGTTMCLGTIPLHSYFNCPAF